jgi:DNA-binding transcriptional regulator YdaS (Cro superfamily)
MTLEKWIEKTTHKKVAKLLKISPPTVSHWYTGHKSPSPRNMLKINKVTKGKVSLLNLVQHAALTQKR